MKLCGEFVKHNVFGIGEIIEFDNNHVTVIFENKEEKKFIYPSSFGKFLHIQNKALLIEIENINAAVASRQLEIKKENEELIKLELNNRKTKLNKKSPSTSKVDNKSNIAFKCNYCDGGKNKDSIGYTNVCSIETIEYNINVAKRVWCSSSESLCNKYIKGEFSRKELLNTCNNDGFVCYESQMLRKWRAYAGIAQKGVNKGKPMKLKSVKANSLAMLTTKLPNEKDEERFIFAVFLIDENYEGDNTEEGYVGANPKYKIQLSLDEAKQIKFWNYYFNPNKPEKILFGSALHRYITDMQAAQVLNEICKVKKGTKDEYKSKELLRFYCNLKRLDIDNIINPNGALKRIEANTTMKFII